MSHRLQVASWALDGALDEVGDDPEPSVQRVAAVMAAEREIALAGVEVCDLAMGLGAPLDATSIVTSMTGNVTTWISAYAS